MTKPGTHSVPIRFPPDTHERLKQAAEDRDVSMNFLVVHAIREMLDGLIPVEDFTLTRQAIPSEQ
jgi:predicted HicB family RNase H-like nuclease